MRKQTARQIFALFAICLLTIVPIIAQQPQRPRTRPATRAPGLAVIIVLDQFRADYLQRFQHLFGARGFKRLMARSAYFTEANYGYANTYTAVGHSTIVTGSVPSIHGIIGNEWYDREAGEVRGVVFDPKIKGVGTERGSSPWRLLSTTLGDQLRLSNNYQSKSIGIAIKDRSATVMAGKKGSAAYWFDTRTGSMVSSTNYLEKLPEWVSIFNDRHFADKYFGSIWDRKLPPRNYEISDDDDVAYEDTYTNSAKHFPYKINGNKDSISPSFYGQFIATPFANDFLVDFVNSAINNEKLDTDEYADLLAISFSSPDLAGHLFGPYSQEMQDMVLRLDDNIATLLDLLDKKYGLDNILLTLTADHGVAPIPEYAKAHGLGGNRIIYKPLLARLEKEIANRYGPGEFILSLINHNIYLNTKLIAEKKLNLGEVEDFVGQEALKEPGIATYFTRTNLLAGLAPNTDLGRRVMAGFNFKNSGNIYLVVEPYTLIAESDLELTGTAHGTPYHYDTHVPILISGPGIKPGLYANACTPSDIAPTLSHLLKIEPPSGSVGRILSEALVEGR